MGSDSETERSQKERKKTQALAPIAKPLAGKKLCKRALKLVRKDKKSAREAKACKRERIELKKRKLDDDENLVESPTYGHMRSEDEPDVKFMKRDEPNKMEREKEKGKLKKKKRSKANAGKSSGDEKNSAKTKCIGEGDSSCAADLCQTETQNERGNNSTEPEEADIGINSKNYDRSKKAAKDKKKDRLLSKKRLKGKTDTVDPDEVYFISSEDEDCPKGMKKWIMEYHQSRPGLKILQQRIDEFITAHEAQEEEAKKEREAQAAEGGWTVVVHHKGRKKTTDSESGITVGSVAQAAVVDKMSKKKTKEVGIDFYRFQRREAQRNEIMMLQSKFEQDRKRIQQLRAARKFRPY